MDQDDQRDEAETVTCGNSKCKSKIVPGDGQDGDETKKKNKKKSQKTTRRRQLMSFSELPDYMKDNEFILNYYRADWSIRDAFFSVFSFHNESLNVWTLVYIITKFHFYFFVVIV